MAQALRMSPRLAASRPARNSALAAASGSARTGPAAKNTDTEMKAQPQDFRCMCAYSRRSSTSASSGLEVVALRSEGGGGALGAAMGEGAGDGAAADRAEADCL